MSAYNSRFIVNVFARIAAERCRQQELLKAGKFTYTCSSPVVDDNRKLRILVEEVGEVAEAIERLEMSKRGHLPAKEHLREELVQVAAVAVAWLESLEKSEIGNRKSEIQ